MTGTGVRAQGRVAWLRTLVEDVNTRLRAQDSTFVAAGLTFYAAIAVVPLMLSAVYLAGLLVGRETIVDLGTRLIDYAPSQLGLDRALTALRDVGPGLGIASFVAALIPGTTYGEGLLRAFARFSDREVAGKSLRGRLLSSVFLATFPLFTVAGLFAVATVEQILGAGVGATILGVYLSFLFGWATTTVLVGLMYGLFGRGRIPPSSLAWGAGATGSVLSGMTLGWLAVLDVGIDVGAAYGGSTDLGSAVLFIVYLYLVQFALVVGYVLTLELARRRGR